jgi:dipeptidyl-peptidase 4
LQAGICIELWVDRDLALPQTIAFLPEGRARAQRIGQLGLYPGQPDVLIESLAQRPVLEVHATPLVLGPRELRAELCLPSWHRPGAGNYRFCLIRTAGQPTRRSPPCKGGSS